MARGFERVTAFKDAVIPQRKTYGAAGYDFCAANDYELFPGVITPVKTGIKVFMEDDVALYLYIRSGLSTKGLSLANGTGLVDQDYYNNEDNEGNIAFLIYNNTGEVFKINKGDRIGQGVFAHYLKATNEVTPTKKRAGGFGSTGISGISKLGQSPPTAEQLNLWAGGDK